MSTITMYYGEECPHCHTMMPKAEKVAKKLRVKLEKKETWHNKKNASEFEKHRDAIIESCGGIGVPAFFASGTGKAICGDMSESAFKSWVEKQKK